LSAKPNPLIGRAYRCVPYLFVVAVTSLVLQGMIDGQWFTRLTRLSRFAFICVFASQCVVDDAQEEVKRLEAEADKILEEDGPESEVLEGLYARLDAMNPELFESKAAKILYV
jgi:hypothetical protein